MKLSQNNVFLYAKIAFFIGIIFNILPVIIAVSASIKSEVIGEGFHRILNYSVDTRNFKNNSCHIAIFLQLPLSLFVNIDELADLRRLYKSSSCSDGEVDIELFAENAYYQNITICSRLTSTKLTLTIPVHQRYHFATWAGEIINVTIPQPKLLIGCRDRLKEHRVSKTKICWPCIEYSKKWRDVSYQWKGDDNFIWQIPIGNTSQRFQVTCITLLITFLCTTYVLQTIYKSYILSKDKQSKDN